MITIDFNDPKSVGTYERVFRLKPDPRDLDPTLHRTKNGETMFWYGRPRMNVNGMLESFLGFMIISVLPERL